MALGLDHPMFCNGLDSGRILCAYGSVSAYSEDPYPDTSLKVGIELSKWVKSMDHLCSSINKPGRAGKILFIYITEFFSLALIVHGLN